jgi:hypothetical protein
VFKVRLLYALNTVKAFKWIVSIITTHYNYHSIYFSKKVKLSILNAKIHLNFGVVIMLTIYFGSFFDEREWINNVIDCSYFKWRLILIVNKHKPQTFITFVQKSLQGYVFKEHAKVFFNIEGKKLLNQKMDIFPFYAS